MLFSKFYRRFQNAVVLHTTEHGQGVFAEEIGMTRTYLNYVINQSKDIQLSTFFEIYKGLGGSPEALI